MQGNTMASITRLVTPRAGVLLGECRALLVDGMRAVLEEFGDRVDDETADLFCQVPELLTRQTTQVTGLGDVGERHGSPRYLRYAAG